MGTGRAQKSCADICAFPQVTAVAMSEKVIVSHLHVQCESARRKVSSDRNNAMDMRGKITFAALFAQFAVKQTPSVSGEYTVLSNQGG